MLAIAHWCISRKKRPAPHMSSPLAFFCPRETGTYAAAASFAGGSWTLAFIVRTRQSKAGCSCCLCFSGFFALSDLLFVWLAFCTCAKVFVPSLLGWSFSQRPALVVKALLAVSEALRSSDKVRGLRGQPSRSLVGPWTVSQSARLPVPNSPLCQLEPKCSAL